MPIDTLFKSPQAKSALNGFLGGAAGGALVSAFTNKKSAKKLLKTGGLVALGGVAWSAYQKYKDGGSQESEPTAVKALAYETEAAPQTVCLSESTLFRAMAAAAYADGHIDAEEQNKIWQQALESGIEGDTLNNLEGLLQNPPGINDVLEDANNMESKLEIYTASVLVVDEDCTAGRQYLNTLKSKLALPEALTSAVEAKVTAA